jgi:hypothetical protein
MELESIQKLMRPFHHVEAHLRPQEGVPVTEKLGMMKWLKGETH